MKKSWNLRLNHVKHAQQIELQKDCFRGVEVKKSKNELKSENLHPSTYKNQCMIQCFCCLYRLLGYSAVPLYTLSLLTCCRAVAVERGTQYS